MFGRTFLLVGILVVGAVLPYLLSNASWMNSAERWWQSVHGGVQTLRGLPAAPQTTGPAAPLPAGPRPGAATNPYAATVSPPGSHPTDPPQPAPGRELQLPTFTGPPGVPLEQLLSFEATPAWISANWARVTTRLAEIDLQGWRVPLATGTSPKDLVGSVTYYFDSLEQLQRISLYGYTGDAEKILTMATQRYQMQTYPSVNGDLYLGFVEGQPLGMLHLMPAPVVRSAAPGSRYQILMEINRTGSPYGLSSECQRILRRTGFPTPVQPTAAAEK